MRRRSGKRKLDVEAHVSVQTAKRPRRKNQEPRSTLTDDVDCNRAEASTAIANEPLFAHATVQCKGDSNSSWQQNPKVATDEQQEQASGTKAGQCKSTTQPSSPLKIKASPVNTHETGEKIQLPIFKTDPDIRTASETDAHLPTVEDVEGKQISELCEKIQKLSAKRQHFKNNEEILRKRLKQSRLTYAEMLRKQSKLIKSLEELKNCLNADERLLSDEKRIADQIPDEIERLSVQLANVCSSRRSKVEDVL